MSVDEDFSRRLRERVDAVGPEITVDTSAVIPRARRRRRAARLGGTVGLAVAVAGATWAVSAPPWAATSVQPAGPGVIVAPDGSAEPPEGVTGEEAAGWPDAPFWHTVTEYADDGGGGQPSRQELWNGHTEPGLIVDEGYEDDPSGMGPASWGSVLLDGERVLVDWDVLYALPTDPADLELLLRASIEADRGVGDDDDKVFAMARDLLDRSPASPALRKAARAVMAGLPGAAVIEGVTDAAGRQGTAVERRDSLGTVYRLVFDPDDGRLLEEVELPGQEADTAAEGDPQGWRRATYLDAGPAEDTPVEPTLESSGCVAWETC